MVTAAGRLLSPEKTRDELLLDGWDSLDLLQLQMADIVEPATAGSSGQSPAVANQKRQGTDNDNIKDLLCCHLCGKQFSFVRQLRSHYSVDHYQQAIRSSILEGDTKTVLCVLCNFLFLNNTGLVRHLGAVHDSVLRPLLPRQVWARIQERRQEEAANAMKKEAVVQQSQDEVQSGQDAAVQQKTAVVQQTKDDVQQEQGDVVQYRLIAVVHQRQDAVVQQRQNDAVQQGRDSVVQQRQDAVVQQRKEDVQQRQGDVQQRHDAVVQQRSQDADASVQQCQDADQQLLSGFSDGLASSCQEAAGRNQPGAASGWPPPPAAGPLDCPDFIEAGCDDDSRNKPLVSSATFEIDASSSSVPDDETAASFIEKNICQRPDDRDPERTVYECRLCGHSSRFSINLRKHLEARHIGADLPCPHCGKVLPNRFALAGHVAHAHEVA